MAREAPPSDNIYVTDLPSDFDDNDLKDVFGAYGHIVQCKVLQSGGPGGQAKCAALVRFQSEEEAAWVVDNLNGNIPQGLADPVGCRFADTPEMKAQRKGGHGKGEGGGGGSRASPYGGGKGYEGRGIPWDFEGGSQTRHHGGIPPRGMHNFGPVLRGLAAGAGIGKGSLGMHGGKGKSKSLCTIKVLHDGLVQAKALPGGTGWINDENALYIANLPVDTADIDLYRIFAPFGAIAPKGVRAMLNEDGSCKGIGFVNFLDPMAAQAAVLTLNGTWLPDGSTLIVREKAQQPGDKAPPSTKQHA